MAADVCLRDETEYLTRTIPRSTVTIYPGEGHNIILTHWAEILAAALEPFAG